MLRVENDQCGPATSRAIDVGVTPHGYEMDQNSRVTFYLLDFARTLAHLSTKRCRKTSTCVVQRSECQHALA